MKLRRYSSGAKSDSGDKPAEATDKIINHLILSLRPSSHSSPRQGSLLTFPHLSIASGSLESKGIAAFPFPAPGIGCPRETMDDDFGADSEFLEALAASEPPNLPQPPKPRVQQPAPQVQRNPRTQQPTPQRLDKPAPASVSGPKAAQPKPQALPQRSSGSAILVSPRQRGNPVLASLRSLPWEYSDIPADYVLGLTTCALFLRCDHFIPLVLPTASASLPRPHPRFDYLHGTDRS